MGRHSKPSRIRLPHVIPTAAAPTLACVVAAFVLSQQMPASASAAGTDGPGPAPHQAALDADYQTGISAARLLASARAAAAQKNAVAAPVTYTVQPGDSLSSVAQRFYHNGAAWPALYWANHSVVQWADNINVGQVLTIPPEPARIPGAPAQLGPAYAPRHASSAPVVAQSGSQPAPPSADSGPAAGSSNSGGVPGGSFAQCVVSRESGGQPQIMNSSGHYGLYQFSASTWAAYGGSPADFGHASVGEQNQVFANAMAAGGENNWAPYDGC